MTFLKRLGKIRIIHCKRYELVVGVVFALVCFFGAYTSIVLEVPASAEQAGAEPVIAGICIVMFLVALGFIYWCLFKEKSFYRVGQYKQYEICGEGSIMNGSFELYGSGEYQLTFEVIWKLQKEDIPSDRSFHLASRRNDNGVRAHIKIEIASDDTSRQFLVFEQRPDQSLNAGKRGVGKTLDRVMISCKEKITINATAKIERKEELGVGRKETFFIRIYNPFRLQETLYSSLNEIVVG